MFFLSKLCVLCLSTCKKIKSVSGEKSEEMLLQKKIKYCLPEIVDSHSAIPKNVCSNCINKLDCFYKFKQICLQNDTYLKNYFQTLTSDESYQHLSIKLPDIKYQKKQQTVNIEQTVSTIVGDEELRTEQKENHEIYIKEEVRDEAQCVDGLDIEESHSLCETENNTGIKEEIPISEDNANIKFYNEYVKNIIKCESIPNNSDVSVSEIEDVVDEDSKCANSNSKTNELFKPAEKNKIRKIQKFKCEICNKEYSRKILLTYHLKVHSGIRDYICTICGKEFIKKCHLVEHEKIHTGLKNYECKICGKKFMQKYHLNRHELIHTGVKNYECAICGKKFMEKSALVKHKIIHVGIKNYECTICKKQFLLKSHLNRHEQIHLDIKKFECSTCKKMFIEKSALVNHEKIHTGVKNYECKICKKQFMLKQNLVRHEKIHVVIKN